MAPKYILEQFLQQELLINITEHEVRKLHLNTVYNRGGQLISPRGNMKNLGGRRGPVSWHFILPSDFPTSAYGACAYQYCILFLTLNNNI